MSFKNNLTTPQYVSMENIVFDTTVIIGDPNVLCEVSDVTWCPQRTMF